MPHAVHHESFYITVAGSVLKADPSTGQGREVQDYTLEDLEVEVFAGGELFKRSILEGVDCTNPEVKKLLANITSCLDQELRDAILEA